MLPLSVYPKPISYDQPPEGEEIQVDIVRPTRPIGSQVRIGLRSVKQGVLRALWLLVPPARWFSTGRLVLMAIVVVVAGTIWFSTYWTRRGELAGQVVAMRAEWNRELARGDFSRARERLEQASTALRRYVGNARDLLEVRQLATEAAIFAELIDMPLSAVLSEIGPLSASETEAYFEHNLKRGTLLLDAFVTASPATGTALAGPRLDAKLLIGQESIRVELSDQALFRGMDLELARRVFFGARIRSIDRAPGSADWVLRLVPESCVLITSALCLEGLDWPLDEETGNLLESQSQWVLEKS